MLSSKLVLRLQLFRADCLLFCVCTVQNIMGPLQKKKKPNRKSSKYFNSIINDNISLDGVYIDESSL